MLAAEAATLFVFTCAAEAVGGSAAIPPACPAGRDGGSCLTGPGGPDHMLMTLTGVPHSGCP